VIYIEFFYSFCVGNSPEARRDLNIATEILLANVTGESTLSFILFCVGFFSRARRMFLLVSIANFRVLV